MSGIVSNILNYYGYIHLSYYASCQFMKPKSEKKDTQNDSTRDDTLALDDSLYLWLSKWIVFVSYVYTEPLLLAILDFIPGVYFLSLALKMKLLSTNNGWHQNLYDMTFGHLQEIDIFHIAWHYSSDKLVLLLVKLLHLLDRLYPKLSDDQLDLLADSLEAASERVREAKTAHEEKENFRKSKLMQRSAMEQVKAEKKANLVESQVFESG